MTPEQQFAELVEQFVGMPGVTGPGEVTGEAAGRAAGGGGRGRFGADALRVNRSIFAMMSSGRLVLKLPVPRVQELITAGRGDPFDAGKGRPMREWVAVRDIDPLAWRELATEAADFVSRGPRPPRSSP